MHSKARLKKLKMVGCWRIDVELYKNFYAKLGVQIRTTFVQRMILLPLMVFSITKSTMGDFPEPFMVSIPKKYNKRCTVVYYFKIGTS